MIRSLLRWPLIAALLLVASSCGTAASEDLGTTDPEPTAPVQSTQLQAAHEEEVNAAEPLFQMLADSLESGGGIVIFTVDDIEVTSTELPHRAELTISAAIPMSPTSVGDIQATRQFEFKDELVLERLFPTSAESLRSWSPPIELVAILDVNGAVLAAAGLAGDGNFLTTEWASDVLVLSNLADQVRQRPDHYLLSTEDACDSKAVTIADPLNDLDALLRGIAFGGAIRELQAAAVSVAQTRLDADRLVHSAPEQQDAVTGDRLLPDPNSVADQLLDGVDEDDIVYPTMIVVGIDATGVDFTSGWLLAFTDTSTGELLSWTVASGFIGTESDVDAEGNPVNVVESPVSRYDVQIPAPAAGGDVGVHLLKNGFPQCESDFFELSPDLLIPHEDIAGERRAEIVVQEMSYRDFFGLDVQP